MTLELLVKCNRCRREWEPITLEQINDILKEADQQQQQQQQDKPLSEVGYYRCGHCVAKDADEAMNNKRMDDDDDEVFNQ